MASDAAATDCADLPDSTIGAGGSLRWGIAQAVTSSGISITDNGLYMV
jgi:hypothetical protein